jgi:hypothetical protein
VPPRELGRVASGFKIIQRLCIDGAQAGLVVEIIPLDLKFLQMIPISNFIHEF